MPLAPGDIVWFSELVLRLHASTSETELFNTLLTELHARFRSGITVIEEAAYDLSSYRLRAGIIPAPFPSDYVVAYDDSPMVLAWQQRRKPEILHLLGMSSVSALHRTTYYDVIGKAMDIEDQLIGTFAIAPAISLNYSVNRDRAFSEDERALMVQIRRHVEACVRRTRDPAGAQRSGKLELRLNAALRPIGMSRDVCGLLQRYFPHDAATVARGELPEEMRRWLSRSFASLRGRPPLRPLAVLRTGSADGQLFTRCFPASPAGGGCLRFTEELRATSAMALRHRGLTVRECEVLHWLMAGKRNREIGVILGCSERTVAVHLEALLRKTMTENRHAAVHAAREWLGGQADGLVHVKTTAEEPSAAEPQPSARQENQPRMNTDKHG